eukprot:TRINITY_DN8162_c0_g1_i1.p1 TRINITY_DN8162_c0_g1~~TRINITY_DN8162_c0_g1_i1.p1  ORF type:complete len:122 (-),score=43.46 TRINITY_DN8162_c0_g1_i1:219-584(-)
MVTIIKLLQCGITAQQHGLIDEYSGPNLLKVIKMETSVINDICTTITRILIHMTKDKSGLARKEGSNSLSNVGKIAPSLIPHILTTLFVFEDDPQASILVWRLFSFRWGILVAKQKTKKKK